MDDELQAEVQAPAPRNPPVGVPAGSIRYRLRAERASPPATVRDDGDRRVLFSAGLEQFDEYMVAAAAVGPATRPVALYYALAQASLSIVAAHATTIRLPSSHGLRLTPDDSNVLHSKIRPVGNGAFQTVAAATGDSPFTGPVEIGELWASLPEVVEAIDQEQWTPALRAGRPVNQETLRLPGVDLVVVFEPLPTTREEFETRLDRYPSLGGATVTSGLGIAQLLTASAHFGGHQIGGALLRWEDAFFNLQILDRAAPEYAVHGQRWVRPRIGGERHVVSPLLTWWALLYALSMLSRYHPVRWANALHIDESPIAANLEFVLDRAVAAIPRLVLGAIWGVDVVELDL